MSILNVNQIQHNTSGSAINVVGSASTTGMGSTGTPTNTTDFTTKGYVDDTVNAAFPTIQIYMIDNATATTIAAANTPVKAAGTTTLKSGNVSFDMPQNNRIRYTGTGTIIVGVNLASTISSGNATQTIGGYLYKNGANVGEGFKQEATTSTATTSRANYNAYGYVELVTNDYLELYVENQTGSNNITVRQLQISIGTA
jgi:hypothetical protein